MLKTKRKHRDVRAMPSETGKEKTMKKNSTPQSTEKTNKKQNVSLATADSEAIIAAAEEYLENGYSYPLFAPGCGCD